MSQTPQNCPTKFGYYKIAINKKRENNHFIFIKNIHSFLFPFFPTPFSYLLQRPTFHVKPLEIPVKEVADVLGEAFEPMAPISVDEENREELIEISGIPEQHREVSIYHPSFYFDRCATFTNVFFYAILEPSYIRIFRSFGQTDACDESGKNQCSKSRT